MIIIGEKLHRGVASLGKDTEQPLFKSFFHHQRSFLFWYVKGAAPHGRPWLVTSSGF